MNMLTLRDVAETFRVSETTVRRLVRSGTLPAYRVGKRGQLRVREDDLESFLEKQRVGSDAGGRGQEASDDPAE